MSDSRELSARFGAAIAALVADLADLIEAMGLAWELERQGI